MPSARGPDCFTVQTYTLLRRRYSACDTRPEILGQRPPNGAIAFELRVSLRTPCYVRIRRLRSTADDDGWRKESLGIGVSPRGNGLKRTAYWGTGRSLGHGTLGHWGPAFLAACLATNIVSNASDKRYLAEKHPFKNVTQPGSAILAKTLNRAANMRNKAAHLRYNFQSCVSREISSVASVSLGFARQPGKTRARGPAGTLIELTVCIYNKRPHSA